MRNQPLQPTSSAARNRKFIEKLKSTGNYSAFKEKKAQCEKKRRERQKASLAHLTDTKRAQILRQNRLKSLARVKKYRQKKRNAAAVTDMEQQISSSSVVKVEDLSGSSMDTNSENDADSPSHSKYDYGDAFENDEEFEAAVAKVERSLPKSPNKRKAVIAALFYEMDEKFQRQMVEELPKPKRISYNGISSDLVETIQQFYERDGISRMSAHVEDLLTFANRSVGEKNFLRSRHLNHTLKKAYTLFKNENSGLSVSLAVFSSLRPEYVKLRIKDATRIVSDVPTNRKQCKTSQNRWSRH